MKHFSIRKFSLCFLSLLFVAAVGLGIGKTLTKKVQAADFAYTDVIISSLHTESGFTWYNFSGHDYAGHPTTSLKTEEYLAKLNTLNTLSKIKLDGNYIGGTFTAAKDPYIDLWEKGGFTINGTAASEVIIEAGCEFPSYAFITGTSTAVYRTKADAKFTLVDGAWIKTREEKDITAAVTASDWSTNWSTDTTQIMLLLNSGDLDVQTKYVNDNPTAYDVDLAEYILINGKSARAIITDNVNKVTNYKGTVEPMTNGGIYSPVLVYVGNNYVSVIILNEYLAQGGFEITVKAGFTVAINDAKCIIKNDLYFGYIQAFNGSEVVTAFTQKFKVTWNVDGNETVDYVAKDYVPEFKGSTDKASTVDKDFTFTGWDVTPAKLTSDVTYTAVYEESARKYNVTFDNGEAVEYAYGSKIEKPANPTKDPTAQYDYTFIGWYNGETAWNFEEDIVTGNVNLTAKFAESVRKYTVGMVDGAYIRLAGEGGLRFCATVSKAEFEKATTYYATVEYGMLIIPKDKAGDELTVDTKYARNVVFADNNRLENEAGDGYEYYAALVGIPASEYEREISARSYVKLTDGDGNVTYSYSEITVVRTIKAVAQAAIESGEFAGNAEVLALLKEFAGVTE